MTDTLETCDQCEDGWVFVEDVELFQGGYMPTHGAEECPSCLGVGRVPTETVIYRVAKQIQLKGGRTRTLTYMARAAVQAYLKETM